MLTMVNRTQMAVLGFFGVAWFSIVVLLVAEPDVYDEALRLGDADAVLRIGSLALISCFIAVLSVGVVRRWRWTFWLVLVAFFAGIVRLPASLLELAGVLHVDLPAWYVAFQGALGIVQFIIGVLMAVGYRRAGCWGAFAGSSREIDDYLIAAARRNRVSRVESRSQQGREARSSGCAPAIRGRPSGLSATTGGWSGRMRARLRREQSSR
ncbi:MAG: hypothetical protein ABI869_00695 [Actinomycetota bacterium]